MGLRSMLDLSTSHLPSGEPDFGDMRSVAHKHGFVVFIDAHAPDVPEWFRPLYNVARKVDCLLVSFDSAGPVDATFPTYDW